MLEPRTTWSFLSFPFTERKEEVGRTHQSECGTSYPPDRRTEPVCVRVVVDTDCPVLAGRLFLLFLFTDGHVERLRWLPRFIELLDRTIVRLHAHRCLQQASFLARVVGNSHANTHNHSLSFLELSLDDSVVSLVLSDSVGMTSNDRFILIRTND